ncbi:hypothetical protein VTK56DRAFT_8504 [Thermocarpiscus australiensis]
MCTCSGRLELPRWSTILCYSGFAACSVLPVNNQRSELADPRRTFTLACAVTLPRNVGVSGCEGCLKSSTPERRRRSGDPRSPSPLLVRVRYCWTNVLYPRLAGQKSALSGTRGLDVYSKWGRLGQAGKWGDGLWSRGRTQLSGRSYLDPKLHRNFNNFRALAQRHC